MKIPQNKLTKAISTLEQALQDDGHDLGNLAHVWFCNIKMPIYDQLLNSGSLPGDVENQQKLANTLSAKAANHLMFHLFHFKSNFE
jgi:hypothetical protein